MDEIIRAVSKDGFVKISVVTARDAVQRANAIHHCSPTAIAALGRRLGGAAMPRVLVKAENRKVTLRMTRGGGLGSIIAVSDSEGKVRGMVSNPAFDLPTRPDGKLDVGGAVGKDGMLTVSRDIGLREPYVGSTELVSGEIAEDITSYYAYSEQIPTVCALGVLVDKDLSIVCAGGYLLQLLPGATDAEITRLEQNIAAMPSVTEMLHAGNTPQDMMELAMAGFDPQVLDTREVQYQCDCSEERTKNMLLSLGRKELEKLRDEDPRCEVVCHFCHTKYEFDLNELLAETTPDEK